MTAPHHFHCFPLTYFGTDPAGLGSVHIFLRPCPGMTLVFFVAIKIQQYLWVDMALWIVTPIPSLFDLSTSGLNGILTAGWSEVDFVWSFLFSTSSFNQVLYCITYYTTYYIQCTWGSSMNSTLSTVHSKTKYSKDWIKYFHPRIP